MATSLRFEIFEDMTGGSAQLEGGFSGNRFDIGGATDTVGSEDLLGGAHLKSWDFGGM